MEIKGLLTERLQDGEETRNAVWSAAFGAAFANRIMDSATQLRAPQMAYREAVAHALRKTRGAARMAKAVADDAVLAAVQELRP